MKKKILVSVVLIFGYIISLAQTPAVVTSEKAGWHKIAERHVGFKSDRDEVVILGNDHFKQIKLKVKDMPINLASYEVVYEDNSSKKVEDGRLINAGEETTPLDVNNAVSIKKIILIYNTVGATKITVDKKTEVNKKGEKEVEREREKETEKERAEVEIWGLK